MEIVKCFEDLLDVKGRQTLWKVAKLFDDVADRSVLNKLDDDVKLVVNNDRIEITDDVAMIHLFEHLELLLFVPIVKIRSPKGGLSGEREREGISNGEGVDFFIVLDDELLDGDKLARLGIQTLEHDALLSLSEDTTEELSRCCQQRQCRDNGDIERDERERVRCCVCLSL